MKFKYMYLPSKDGAKTMAHDGIREFCWRDRRGHRNCGLVPAGTLSRIPLGGPAGFPRETTEEVLERRTWHRVTAAAARDYFGQTYLDLLSKNDAVTREAASIPVSLWGTADDFEDKVFDVCEEILIPQLCAQSYVNDLMNELCYSQRFDAYTDSSGQPCDVVILGRDTIDFLPHTVSL